MSGRIGSAPDQGEMDTESNMPSEKPVAQRGGVLRSVARTLLWPARRFFDPRIAGLAQAIEVTKDELRALLEADLDASTEAAAVLGQDIDELRNVVGRIEERLMLADGGRVEDMHETTAQLLNYASSHRGFAAQRNLWFNWPVSVTYEPRNVTLGNINERVAEIAYAFRALAGIEPGAEVLTWVRPRVPWLSRLPRSATK